MNSKQVKAEFARHGMTVRVRDLGLKFRVCGVTKKDIGELVECVAVGLGFTSVLGIPGGSWNGGKEFIAYKPGSVRREAA